MNDIANFIISELEPYKKYGTIIQENGTELIGKATHIAPMAWLHSLFKGLEKQEIEKLETELNTEIPNRYAEFLKFSNGLQLFNTTLSFHGLRKSYDRVTEINARNPFSLTDLNYERPLNSKPDYFYFGSYFWDGSLVFIDKSDSKIHRCDRDDSKPLNTWNDFNDFIKNEIIRIKSLHKENGTEKNPDESTIPE
ncbi:SMI1/KNR4 family protein [Aquimarina sp. LLG6339-5]|uniref:SMI1/KNR4 family protein n=1 Tax=Aquimarina sp. LLG6339-5 TaxID=3160830 RepID=UPI00386C02D4